MKHIFIFTWPRLLELNPSADFSILEDQFPLKSYTLLKASTQSAMQKAIFDIFAGNLKLSVVKHSIEKPILCNY